MFHNIEKRVLCCTTSITDLAAEVMLGSRHTDPTFYFFFQITDTFTYSPKKGEKFFKQNAYKHIHVFNSC